jgi:adenine-specific DNA-methyltransferase
MENVKLSDLSINKQLVPEDCFLKYMFAAEEKEETLTSFNNFNNPFDYRLLLFSNKEKKSSLVDLPETFNYLMGLKVKKNHSRVSFGANFIKGPQGILKANLKKGNTYTNKSIEELPDGDSALVIWRSITGDIQKDNAALQAYRLKFGKFKHIFINGQSNIKGASLIEDLMKSKMFEDL